LFFFQGKCDDSLVTGPRGVPDKQITASSYYEDSLYVDSPERARLNLEEERVQRNDGKYAILGGGWMARDKTKNQWLQVRFSGSFTVKIQCLLWESVTAGEIQ
jgi:hypothetical protein